MIESSFTLYKLIILYMLQNVNFPLSNTQISDFILEKEYTNYFHLQEALSELQDTKLIEDCGFDSLNIMDLLTEIENVFGVDFMDLENFEEKFNVCSQLCEGIEKLVAQKRGDCISE